MSMENENYQNLSNCCKKLFENNFSDEAINSDKTNIWYILMQINGTNYLITGATGFLGSNIIKN